MKISTCLTVTAFATAMATSATALAKDCSEVTWKEAVISEYPQIADACQGVVEFNGKEYVELDAKYVRSAGDQVRIRFMHQDGDYGPTYETKNLPKNFQIEIDGRQRSIHTLTRDSTMQLFVPTDRFAIVAKVDDMPSEQDQMMVADASSYQSLPSTASNTSLLGLLGALACSLALALSVLGRKRQA